MTNRGGWWTAEQIRDMCAKAWDEGANEAYSLGWMHSEALVDMLGRNPHRE